MFEETSLEDLFEVNVLGPITLIQTVLPAMRVRMAGHIVNITPVSGLAAWVGTSVHSATKYAMEYIGETLANEVREHGIKVTNAAPGGMRTDFAGRSLAVVLYRSPNYDGAVRDADGPLRAMAARNKAIRFGRPLRSSQLFG